jgi:RNA polymerase sigma factor (sigma-70 family)
VLKELSTRWGKYHRSVSLSDNDIKAARRMRNQYDALIANGSTAEQAFEQTLIAYVRDVKKKDVKALDAAKRDKARRALTDLLALNKSDLSLDAPIGDEEDDTLGDIIDADMPTPEEIVCDADEIKRLFAAVCELEPRKRFIIVHTFGLFGCAKVSQVDIAKRLNISRQRVGSIIRDIIDELHGKMGGGKE